MPLLFGPSRSMTVCLERSIETQNGGFAIFAVGNDLGQERIVVGRHRVALAKAGFDSQIAGTGRPHQLRESVPVGGRIIGGIFGIDPRLDGVTARRTPPCTRSAAKTSPEAS